MQHPVHSPKCSKYKTCDDQLFLTKVIKIDATRCLDFSSKCIKMRLAAGLRPDPLGDLTALPRTSYLDSRGPTSKRKGGECAQFCNQILGDRNP